jgi:valyl-tRNA synthetase
LRREQNIPAGKKVKFILKPTGAIPPHDVEVLRLLLNAEALDLDSNYQPPKGTPSVHSEMGNLYLPLEGVVDVQAEKARQTKELEKIETEIAKAEQKLNNPNFTAKAPSHVLQEHQQRLGEWKAKRDRVKGALDRLK